MHTEPNINQLISFLSGKIMVCLIRTCQTNCVYMYSELPLIRTRWDQPFQMDFALNSEVISTIRRVVFRNLEVMSLIARVLYGVHTSWSWIRGSSLRDTFYFTPTTFTIKPCLVYLGQPFDLSHQSFPCY